LGQGSENGLGSCHLHNSLYDFNDEVLPLGAALHASLAEHLMPLQALLSTIKSVAIKSIGISA
jgi:hypothetical protein